MQHSQNVVVRREFDLHHVDVRERAGVLGSSPQDSRLIKILGQPPNRSSMPLPRLPLLTSTESTLIALMQADSQPKDGDDCPEAITGKCNYPDSDGEVAD